MAERIQPVPQKSKALSFGELLDRHLLSGTRPRGSSAQGRAWGKGVFAANVGVSDRQLRNCLSNWLRNEKWPTEIENH